MFRLTKKFRFEASHQLPSHPGKCKNLHGHSWQGSITVEGDTLKDGMLIDYYLLSQIAKGIEEKLDHQHLNDFIDNPTSEHVAEFIAKMVTLPPHVRLVKVNIQETCTTECECTL